MTSGVTVSTTPADGGLSPCAVTVDFPSCGGDPQEVSVVLLRAWSVSCEFPPDEMDSGAIDPRAPIATGADEAGADGEEQVPIPRMYPETALPLLKISREKINEAKKTLPRLRADIKEELQRGGLNEEMAGLLMKKGKIEEFKEMSSILKIPSLIAKILLVYPKEIASHEKISEEQIEENLNIDALLFIVEALKDSKISEGDVKEVMRLIAKGTAVENAIKLEKADVSGIEERIMKVIKGKPGLNVNAYMGLIMQSPEFKSKISGREAMEIIKKYVR